MRAKGITELKNAAIEPEIMDLIAVLQKMGAIISIEPNRVILIEGVDSLKGYDHRALFDRNEGPRAGHPLLWRPRATSSAWAPSSKR